MFKQNANSQYIDNSRQTPIVNRSVTSIKSEQIFNKKSLNPEGRVDKSEIIPYNMTPFVKLHEPIRTKLTKKEELDKSIKNFEEPAENSQVEVNLYEQSIDKSIQDRQIEQLDPFRYTVPIEDPKINQLPQLFVEPPIIIPYLLTFVQWDPQQMKSITIKQNEHEEIFIEFKTQLQKTADMIYNKFRCGKQILNFLETKHSINDQLSELDFQLSQFLINENNPNTEQINEYELKNNEELTQNKEYLERTRKEIYRIRSHCLELLSLCDHQDDVILHTNDFGGNLKQLSENFEYQSALFEEQILVYVLQDNLGIERIIYYLKEGYFDDSEEVTFFNGIVEFRDFLEKSTMNLRELVKLFIIHLKEQLHKSNQLLQKQNQAFMQLEERIQILQQLFQEIPTLLMKLQLSLESGKLQLTRIKIPHLINQSSNNEIYQNFEKEYQENMQLIDLIEQKINSSEIKSESSQQQKDIVLIELSQCKQENANIYDLYQFMLSIPQKESQISKVQQDRLYIWQQLSMVTSEELLHQSKQDTMNLRQQCESIIESITQFFGQYKMPYQFVRLKQWAESELQALKIELEIPYKSQTILSLQQRIQELFKWEHSSVNQQGEIGEIISQLKQLYEQDNQDKKQIQLEIDIEKQFNQLEGNEYSKLLQLNEKYHIWKNMQASGIYLNKEHIVDLLKTKDVEKMKKFQNKISQLKIFFQLVNQNQYTAYITDMNQLIEFVKNQQLSNAKEFLQNSKAIPQLYKKNIEQQLN